MAESGNPERLPGTETHVPQFPEGSGREDIGQEASRAPCANVQGQTKTLLSKMTPKVSTKNRYDPLDDVSWSARQQLEETRRNEHPLQCNEKARSGAIRIDPETCEPYSPKNRMCKADH